MEWNERADEHDQVVTKALRKERNKGKDNKSKNDKDDADGDAD